jgi:hypothetical protein
MRPEILDEDFEGLIDESHVESPELRAALDEAIREDDEGNDPGIVVTRESLMKMVKEWIAEWS